MDDLVFSKAANGENSCALGKIRLHSSYNPSKEAERFANEAHCDFSPSHVIVTEPALSFCLPFLKKRFPDSKFCAVRYTESFSEYDTGWDKIFNVKTGSLSSELFLTLGDEGIIS